MRNDIDRIAIISLATVFLMLTFLLRKKISYLFCPLETYAGRINKGKSTYVSLIHLMLSLAVTLICYSLLSDISWLSLKFEDTVIRLSVIAAIWIAWIFFIGLLIETYLMATDKDYKEWREKYLKK